MKDQVEEGAENTKSAKAEPMFKYRVVRRAFVLNEDRHKGIKVYPRREGQDLNGRQKVWEPDIIELTEREAMNYGLLGKCVSGREMLERVGEDAELQMRGVEKKKPSARVRK